MARPDDNHVPRALVGDDGEVIAVAHVAPDADPVVFEHLRAVVEAARRMREQLPAEERGESERRKAAARERCRERLEQIRGHRE